MSFVKGLLVTLLFLIPLGLILSIILIDSPTEHLENRIERAQSYENRIEDLAMHYGDSLYPQMEPLVIAIAWPISTTSTRLVEGVQLAEREINQNGGIYGQPIKLKYYDTMEDIEHSRKNALDIGADEEIIAVIGHLHPDIAQATSFIYDSHGLLFITPGCQAYLPSLQEVETFFRTIPNTVQMAAESANYTQQLNYRNPVIITEDDVFAERFSKLYQINLNKYGIKPVYNFQLLKWKGNHRMIINQLKLFEFDLVVMAITPEQTDAMLKETAKTGLNHDIMTINYNSQLLTSNHQYDSTLIYNLSSFEIPDEPTETLNIFLDNFRMTYEDSLRRAYVAADLQDHIPEELFIKPDGHAAYGYDALMLVAAAIKGAKSIHPISLTTYLQFHSSLDGVTGSNKFDSRGNVYLKPLFMTKLWNGEHMILTKSTANLQSFNTRLSQELSREVERKEVIIYSDSSKALLLIEDDVIFNDETSAVDSTGREILKKIGSAAFGNKSIVIQLKCVNKVEVSSFSLALGHAIADMETSIKASRISSFLIRYGIEHDQIFTKNSSINHDEVFPVYEYPDEFEDEHIEILIVQKSDIMDDY